MARIFFIALFFFVANYANAQLLWQEDFLGESDGDQIGNATGTPGGTWSTTDPSVRRQDMPIAGEILLAGNTGSEERWQSNNIDISSAGYAIISADVWTALVDGSDYLRLYYRVDGGPEILFYDLAGGNNGFDLEPATPASAIVSGSTLQIIARFRNNTTIFIFFPLPSLYGLDNITVTPADILYSRKSGTWTDVTGGFGGTGTWSTNISGVPACGCVPLNDIVAIIQNGHTVTLSTSQTAIGGTGTPNLAPGAVDIQSGGVLQYNTSGVTLGVQQGLFRVRSGGVVNSSSAMITDEQLAFQANVGGAALVIDAGGSVSVEDFVLTTAATNLHYLTGGGALTITDDIIINASDATLTNNLATTISVGGDLTFNSDRSSMVNNGTVNFAGNVVVAAGNDDDNIVTNSSGSSLTVGSIDANDADLDIFNSGTITQTGNFIDIDDGDTNFDNLSTGIWNWSLTPNTSYDTDVATVLNLTASGNTFNYNGAGAQRIIPTTYHHISLSNSGAKDANNASFSVRGDWTVSGTASFTEGTGTITLDGSVAQTITNLSGETFRNLTIDNSFGASPQITINGNVTVSNILTMGDGNVNLNGYTFSLSSTASGALVHGLAAADGWMYGGSFSRARPASAAFMTGATEDDRALFPLGSASDWRPFFVGQSSDGNSGGTMTISHTNSTSTSDVSIPDLNPGATITKRHNSFWTVSTSGIGSGATFYLRAGGTNFGVIANVSHLRMATSNGVVGTNIAGAGTSANPRVRRSVTFANLVNNFHLASTDATNSPLPIELLSFSTQLQNNFVELKWSTATETNNDFFTIERSTNVEHFEPILTHDGAGSTKELNHYNVIDPSPLYGRSYYRLKQTDFDGKFTYSSVRVIDYDGPEHATLSVFPNPSSGKNLSIKIEGLTDATEVPVQIVNMQGQKVYEKTIMVKTPGVITEQISNEKILPTGVYVVKAGNTLYLTQKIVIE